MSIKVLDPENARPEDEVLEPGLLIVMKGWMADVKDWALRRSKRRDEEGYVPLSNMPEV